MKFVKVTTCLHCVDSPWCSIARGIRRHQINDKIDTDYIPRDCPLEDFKISTKIKKPDKCCPAGSYDCQVPVKIKNKVVSVDICVADIVTALNAGGIETVASCCGHDKYTGDVALKDGRMLMLITFEEWHKETMERNGEILKLKTENKELRGLCINHNTDLDDAVDLLIELRRLKSENQSLQHELFKERNKVKKNGFFGGIFERLR